MIFSILLILAIVSEARWVLNVLAYASAYVLFLIFAAKLVLIFMLEVSQLMPISNLVSEAGEQKRNGLEFCRVVKGILFFTAGLHFYFARVIQCFSTTLGARNAMQNRETAQP